MQKLRTGYTMYFNTKYEHSGAPFQERCKSTIIERDAQFMHIPHYIHPNALDATLPNLRERNLGEKEIRSANESYPWTSRNNIRLSSEMLADTARTKELFDNTYRDWNSLLESIEISRTREKTC